MSFDGIQRKKCFQWFVDLLFRKWCFPNGVRLQDYLSMKHVRAWVGYYKLSAHDSTKMFSYHRKLFPPRSPRFAAKAACGNPQQQQQQQQGKKNNSNNSDSWFMYYVPVCSFSCPQGHRPTEAFSDGFICRYPCRNPKAHLESTDPR